MDTQNRLNLDFKTNYLLMQVNSIAECSHSAILLTFVKLPFVIKIFVLSIFSGCLTQVLLYIKSYCHKDSQKNIIIDSLLKTVFMFLLK